jgi:predicted AAA+ superfamily ATPase
MDLLVRAGLVYKVYHSSARGIPLAAQIDEKKYKAFLFDIGIHQRLLGLNLGEHILASDVELINEGNLAEVYAGIEMIAGFSARTAPQLYYWHREARASNAEVDYVIARGATIVPVEVKAGTRGGMKSMGLFLDEGHALRGARLSQENYSKLDRVDVLPLYAAGSIVG